MSSPNSSPNSSPTFPATQTGGARRRKAPSSRNKIGGGLVNDFSKLLIPMALIAAKEGAQALQKSRSSKSSSSSAAPKRRPASAPAARRRGSMVGGTAAFPPSGNTYSATGGFFDDDAEMRPAMAGGNGLFDSIFGKPQSGGSKRVMTPAGQAGGRSCQRGGSATAKKMMGGSATAKKMMGGSAAAKKMLGGNGAAAKKAGMRGGMRGGNDDASRQAAIATEFGNLSNTIHNMFK